jgi:hypothetical protein
MPALLSDEAIAARAKKRAGFRLKQAGTKLSQSESQELESLTKTLGVTQSEFIRELILDRLAQHTGVPIPSPELVEIIGLRLMLTNFLRPLASGKKVSEADSDAIMTTRTKRTRPLAAEILMVSRSDSGDQKGKRAQG